MLLESSRLVGMHRFMSIVDFDVDVFCFWYSRYIWFCFLVPLQIVLFVTDVSCVPFEFPLILGNVVGQQLDLWLAKFVVSCFNGFDPGIFAEPKNPFEIDVKVIYHL